MTEFTSQKVEDSEVEQRIPSTVLPTDLILSLGEIDELYYLEQMYKSGDFSETRLVWKFNIENTANVGIHYFCVENDFALEGLAYSRRISATIAELILNVKINNRKAHSLQIIDNLVVNPIVYNNFALFQKVYNYTPEGYLLTKMQLRASSMPVEVLLFILPKARKSRYAGTKKSYERIFDVRKYDILNWLKENNPELEGLPETWVLKAYDIYNWS